MNVEKYNTTALAFMGDAVFEVYVREMVMAKGICAADSMHLLAVKYVRAENQALAIKTMYETLEPTEQSLVRRARNRKIATKAKNVTPMTYKWATAFEALVGYLYLTGNKDRLAQIMEKAVIIIESGAPKQTRPKKIEE